MTECRIPKNPLSGADSLPGGRQPCSKLLAQAHRERRSLSHDRRIRDTPHCRPAVYVQRSSVRRPRQNHVTAWRASDLSNDLPMRRTEPQPSLQPVAGGDPGRRGYDTLQGCPRVELGWQCLPIRTGRASPREPSRYPCCPELARVSLRSPSGKGSDSAGAAAPWSAIRRRRERYRR